MSMRKTIDHLLNCKMLGKFFSKFSMRKTIDHLLTACIWISSFVTVGVLAWILLHVLLNGIGHINWEFLSTAAKGHEGGILPMIVSTVAVVLVAVGISTPIGVCAAIYLVEYAKPGKVVRAIRFATETLAGIPSIIYGMFGMIFFVNLLKLGFSILAGAVTLSIMVLPTIVRTTEEALKAVPIGFKEGSLALGASKLRTISRVILPSAIPGILAAIILSIGRIVGETAALYFTAGTVPRMPTAIMDSARTLSVHLYLLVYEGISFEKAYATATVLVVVVAVINFMANRMVMVFKKH